MRYNTARNLITLGIFSLCVLSYWVGMMGGAIQCSHRCYWCWAKLVEEKP